MKFFNRSGLLALAVAALALAATTARADDKTPPKPDLLTTCPVSGDKLGGDMGKPIVFTYKGQEVKLCCPDCKSEFLKNPDKYIAKIRAADKKPSDK
jgi:YHS domain-containing protein